MSEFRAREGLAWAAGFFDGEGSFAAVAEKRTRQPSYSARVSIQQSSHTEVPEVLVRFQDVLGMGQVGGPILRKTKRGVDRAPMYWYTLYGFEKVQAAIAMLWPFLSSPKREQAARVLNQLKS